MSDPSRGAVATLACNLRERRRGRASCRLSMGTVGGRRTMGPRSQAPSARTSCVPPTRPGLGAETAAAPERHRRNRATRLAPVLAPKVADDAPRRSGAWRAILQAEALPPTPDLRAEKALGPTAALWFLGNPPVLRKHSVGAVTGPL